HLEEFSGFPGRWMRQVTLLGGSVVMVLHVDVLSDVICPWCYLGKRRLAKAAAVREGPVTARWLAFQLNPTIPKEGTSQRKSRTRKCGSGERAQELDARLVAVGEGEVIHSAFEQIDRTPHTLDAHRLQEATMPSGVVGSASAAAPALSPYSPA